MLSDIYGRLVIKYSINMFDTCVSQSDHAGVVYSSYITELFRSPKKFAEEFGVSESDLDFFRLKIFNLTAMGYMPKESGHASAATTTHSSSPTYSPSPSPLPQYCNTGSLYKPVSLPPPRITSPVLAKGMAGSHSHPCPPPKARRRSRHRFWRALFRKDPG